jgi:hypothetical protein
LLNHPTLDLLNELGLFGMAKAFAEIESSGDAATLTHAEWFGLLLDREMTYRNDKRLRMRLRYAKLRHQAVIEDIDYRAPRGLDRALFNKLAEGSWIDAHDNLILCGPTGIGKSWLACALGHKACRDNRSVLYQRIPKLLVNGCPDPWKDGAVACRSEATAWAVDCRAVTAPAAPEPPFRAIELILADVAGPMGLWATLLRCPHIHRPPRAARVIAASQAVSNAQWRK